MSRIIFHIDVNSAFLSWTAVKLLREGKADIRLSWIITVHGTGNMTRRKPGRKMPGCWRTRNTAPTPE